jgi:hypothetical protein
MKAERGMGQMTFDQFVSFCGDYGRGADSRPSFDDLYKSQGWDAEDRRRLCLLHGALEHLGPFAPDSISEEDAERAFEYWRSLPGREELKLEAWRQVFFEEPLRRFEAIDISDFSPEAREVYIELIDGERENATLFALGVVPWPDGLRGLMAGGDKK